VRSYKYGHANAAGERGGQEGVYKVSAEAKAAGKTGGHAVMMVGWGTDAVGGDYWYSVCLLYQYQKKVKKY
jgi:hypothetical protein